MAFQKTITQKDTGISANYWRLSGIFIDPAAFAVRLVLLGYVNADIRQANGRAIDMREYVLTPPQFGALARADAQGKTAFDVIATACYGHIASAPRGLPEGYMFDPETGSVTIPNTGEVIPAELVKLNEEKLPQWLPSEFADAALA